MVAPRAADVFFDETDEQRRRREAEESASANGLPLPVTRPEDIPLAVPAVGTQQGGFAPMTVPIEGGATGMWDPVTGAYGVRGPADQGFVFPTPTIAFTPDNDPERASGLADYMARQLTRSNLNTEAGRAARAEGLRYSDMGIRGDPLAGLSVQDFHAPGQGTNQFGVITPSELPPYNAADAAEALYASRPGLRPEPPPFAGFRPGAAPGGAEGPAIPEAFPGFRPGAAPGGPEGPAIPPTQPQARRAAGFGGAEGPNVEAMENQNRQRMQAALAGTAPQTGETGANDDGVTFPIVGRIATPEGVTGQLVRFPDGRIMVWNSASNEYEDPSDGIWARYSR